MWWLFGFIAFLFLVTWWENRGPTHYTSRKEWYRNEYLHSKHWRKTRNRALVRANFKCQSCGSCQRLQVHHLTYAHLGNELDSDLKVLCNNCHKRVHKK